MRKGERDRRNADSHDTEATAGARVAEPAAAGDGVVRLPPLLALTGAPVQEAAGLGLAVITCAPPAHPSHSKKGDKNQENSRKIRAASEGGKRQMIVFFGTFAKKVIKTYP